MENLNRGIFWGDFILQAIFCGGFYLRGVLSSGGFFPDTISSNVYKLLAHHNCLQHYDIDAYAILLYFILVHSFFQFIGPCYLLFSSGIFIKKQQLFLYVGIICFREV